MPLFKKKREGRDEFDIGYPYPAQPELGLPEEPFPKEPRMPAPGPMMPTKAMAPMPRPMSAQKVPIQPEPLAPMPSFERRPMAPPMPPMETEKLSELPEVMEKRAPVFVKLDEYQKALKSVGSIQDRVNELQDNVNRLKAVMSKEAEVVAAWNVLINDAKAKLTEINSILFEPKGA